MEPDSVKEPQPVEEAQLAATVADPCTGATTEVTVVVDRAPSEVWDTVTDISSIGRWSPETYEAEWLDGATGPTAGARYRARNRFPDGFVSEMICVVTRAERPHHYGWEVRDLDDAAGEEPLAWWEYELAPGAGTGQTVITHRFVHGPGTTNVRLKVRAEPERADEIVDGRLKELNQIMTTTLAAMFAGLP